MFPNDAEYLAIILDPIRVCKKYKPKFGKGTRGGGLTLSEFQTLYERDSFYRWFGLDNPMMYAAHKAAGGMTSVYRQLGIGCEALFRRLLQDHLGLSDTAVRWSYTVPTASGRSRRLHLDGRVPLAEITDMSLRKRFHTWMSQSATAVGVDKGVFDTLKGTVFEVRQGYKSKDSKRQNADISNAAAAYTKAYLPCAVILSTQIDSDVLHRYRAEQWAVLTGIVGIGDPWLSTYDFLRDVVGYDLAAFFDRNHTALRSEIDSVLRAILLPEPR